jgi:hypothetical protein
MVTIICFRHGDIMNGTNIEYDDIYMHYSELAFNWHYHHLYNCNTNAFYSFDLLMVYIPEYRYQQRTMK